MPPERFMQYVLAVVLAIVVVFLLIWAVNELDDEDNDGPGLVTWELLD